MKVQLFYDEKCDANNPGWVARNPEDCDVILDAKNYRDVEKAIMETISYYGGSINRDDIVIVE